MDLNARVNVNCGRKDGRTENRTPISHLAKAGATKNELVAFFPVIEYFMDKQVNC